jgi:hypothetical protein
LEQDGALALQIPFGQDALQFDLGGKRQFFGTETDLHRGDEDVIQLLAAFGAHPGGHLALAGQMDYVQQPPLIHIDETLKMGLEGTEKNGLPVQAFRKMQQHFAQASPAIAQAQQFMNEQVRAAMVKVNFFRGKRLFSGPVQLIEGQRRLAAQIFPSAPQRINVPLPSRNAGLRLQHEVKEGCGLKVRGQTFRQPERQFGLNGAGVAVRDLQQQDLDY